MSNIQVLNPYGIQDHLSVSEINDILRNLKPDDIAALECKHAVYTQSQSGADSDMVTVKQLIHLKDGRKIPSLKFFKDYERPFWITHKRYQNHKDKKEWEYKDKLIERKCKQLNLRQSVCQALGYGNPRGQMKTIARSPFLYGVDITTPTLIKESYQRQWPNTFTPNTVAVIDSETDVLYDLDAKNPILLTLTYRNRVLVTVLKDWIKDTPDFTNRLDQCINKHLKDDFEARGIKMDVVVCDNAAEMVVKIIEACHVWQPDFVTFWNMDFDMTVMLNVLEKADVNLAELFSDPRVPKDYRYFNYRRGPSMKVKANGNVENLASYDRWHVVEFPASFQFVDAMCVYRQIRKAKGKAPSYSLNYTLDTNLNRSKLYFDIDVKGVQDGSLEWHAVMQREYKIEYTAYNIFDCIGVELLDEKTRDLQTQISVLSGYSEYGVFSSNPKRTSDKLHFFCLGVGKVAGCVSDQMADELDKLVVDKDDWIDSSVVSVTHCM